MRNHDGDAMRGRPRGGGAIWQRSGDTSGQAHEKVKKAARCDPGGIVASAGHAGPALAGRDQAALAAAVVLAEVAFTASTVASVAAVTLASATSATCLVALLTLS